MRYRSLYRSFVDDRSTVSKNADNDFVQHQSGTEQIISKKLKEKNAHRKVNFKDKFPSELMNSNYFFMGLKSKGCMRDKKFSILV